MSMVKTPASILNEILQKLNKTPQYVLQPSDGLGTHNPIFRIRVEADNVIGYGVGRTKKEAKHEAAKDALLKFADSGLYIPSESDANPENSQIPLNVIVLLNELIAEYNLPAVKFTEILKEGPVHNCHFTFQCAVGPLKITASDYNKKKAKQNSAHLMYQCLLKSLSQVQNFNVTNLYDDTLVNMAEVLSNKNNCKSNTDYEQTMTKMIKNQKLCIKNLWQDVNSATEENLKKILNKFDLKYSLKTANLENTLTLYLSVNSEPIFSISKIAPTRQDAVAYLINEAFEFLKMLTL